MLLFLTFHIVDAASGGFVAPFITVRPICAGFTTWTWCLFWLVLQTSTGGPPFLSTLRKYINFYIIEYFFSGRKFGLSYVGVVFTIWRDQDHLLKDLIFELHYLSSVEYLFSLNFSHPAEFLCYPHPFLGWLTSRLSITFFLKSRIRPLFTDCAHSFYIGTYIVIEDIIIHLTDYNKEAMWLESLDWILQSSLIPKWKWSINLYMQMNWESMARDWNERGGKEEERKGLPERGNVTVPYIAKNLSSRGRCHAAN